jgi:hypothetical protein
MACLLYIYDEDNRLAIREFLALQYRDWIGFRAAGKAGL